MKRVRKTIVALILSLVCLLGSTLTVFASNVSPAQAYEALQDYTGLDKCATVGDGWNYEDNEYKMSGGGYYMYMDIATGDSNFINEKKFSELTAGAKQDFLKDMLYIANLCAAEEESGITTETVNDMMEVLQNKSGMGSQLLATLLANTKPDYATANKLYQPFSGVVGTILGVISVLIMALLGITMALDIAFITIPTFQLVMGADGSGQGGADDSKKMARIISQEARQAVELANNSGGSGGQSGDDKMALGVYFKKRWKGLVLLGICLLYLVQGQIYSLVAWIIDLLSGFLGF